MSTDQQRLSEQAVELGALHSAVGRVLRAYDAGETLADAMERLRVEYSLQRDRLDEREEQE